MSLRSINLNLLPILQALLHEGSVVKAARRAGLSQPAVSGALSKLRAHFDDPLLVRVGRTTKLTPRALILRAEVDRICQDVEAVLLPGIFDPMNMESEFVIAAPDYLAYLLTEALIGLLPTIAPKIRIRFVDVPINMPEMLHDTAIDMTVCANFGLWPELCYESVWEDRIVVVSSRGHPITQKKSISSEELKGFPSVHFDRGVTSLERDTESLTGLPSLDHRTQIGSQHFMHGLLLATNDGCVARVPSSLALSLKELLPIEIMELAEEDSSFDTGLFWSPIQDKAPEQVWLRGIIRDQLINM